MRTVYKKSRKHRIYSIVGGTMLGYVIEGVKLF